MSEDLSFILDNQIWSYSSLESFRECKYGFYLNYILRNRGGSGCFSEFGSLCHELLEDFLKDKLFSFELLDQFESTYYSKVSNTFPPIKGGRLYDKYFQQGVEYFQATDRLELLKSDYGILGVEDKHFFDIDQYKFTGVLDVEVENRLGEFEIIDHKSKSKQHITRLTKKHNREDWLQLTDERYVPRNLFNQQYIYCVPFKAKFGEYPKYLNLNMLRINDWYKIEFNKDDFEKSKLWAVNTIKDIYKEYEWTTNKGLDDFFCKYLCGVSPFCKYSEKYVGEV